MSMAESRGKDWARELGRAIGDSERAQGLEPRENPLSGEWADDYTPRRLRLQARLSGFPTPVDYVQDALTDGLDEFDAHSEWADVLAESFEFGYFAAWEDSAQS